MYKAIKGFELGYRQPVLCSTIRAITEIPTNSEKYKQWDCVFQKRPSARARSYAMVMYLNQYVAMEIHVDQEFYASGFCRGTN